MKRLYFARFIFLMLVALNIYLFTAGRADYGYTLAVLVFICSFIPISFLEVTNERLRITKYYLFGFARFQYVILREHKPEILDFDAEQYADFGHLDGDLTQLIMNFTAKPGAFQRNIILSYTNGRGQKKKLRLRLNKSKYGTLKSFINQ